MNVVDADGCFVCEAKNEATAQEIVKLSKLAMAALGLPIPAPAAPQAGDD